MTALDYADIEHRFRPHAGYDLAHIDLYDSIEDFAHYLAAELPDGRQKSLAFTALEEVSFRAHASVAQDSLPTLG